MLPQGTLHPRWEAFTDDPPRHLKLRLASDAERSARQCGVVVKPDTMNYRTLVPEQGGLFDEEIFGPLSTAQTRDDSNAQLRHLGDLFSTHRHTSDGKIERSDLTTRFGVMELPVEMIHPLWITRCSDDLEAASGWSMDEIEQRGATALARQLESRDELTYVVIDSVLVLPVYVRPLVPLADGGFATSDLNDLYRRVVNRSNRLRRLMELDAPEIIISNEQRMLQEALNNLFDNQRAPHGDLTDPDGRPLVSLVGMVESEGALDALDEIAARGQLDGSMGRPALAALRALEAMALTVY